MFTALPQSIDPLRKATALRSGRVQPLPCSVTFTLWCKWHPVKAVNLKKATLNISIVRYNLANKGHPRLYIQVIFLVCFIKVTAIFLQQSFYLTIKVEFNPIEKQVMYITVHPNFTTKANSYKQMCIMGRMLIILSNY